MRKMPHINDKPSQKACHTPDVAYLTLASALCRGSWAIRDTWAGTKSLLWQARRLLEWCRAGPWAWFECPPYKSVVVSCIWKSTEAALDLVRNSVTIDMWHLPWAWETEWWFGVLSETVAAESPAGMNPLRAFPLTSCVTLDCCLTSGHPFLLTDKSNLYNRVLMKIQRSDVCWAPGT